MGQAEKILIIGANGQIGTELSRHIANIYGNNAVITADLSDKGQHCDIEHLSFNILDKSFLEEIVEKYSITQIYNLAATLSANGEKNPKQSWELNINGLLNVLDVASDNNIKVFWPSSIAVFGPSTPAHETPQQTIMEPSSVYGISKLAGEGWCRWYHLNRGVDVRSLRFPGLLSYKTKPGGGTTDYAIDLLHSAANNRPYECFLEPDTILPMMYMDDAVRAIIELMNAPAQNILERGSYNLAAISFSPRQLTEEIQRQGFYASVVYRPDYRQKIASSWPDTIDDCCAREQWGWKPAFDLQETVRVMLENMATARCCFDNIANTA